MDDRRVLCVKKVDAIGDSNQLKQISEESVVIIKLTSLSLSPPSN